MPRWPVIPTKVLDKGECRVALKDTPEGRIAHIEPYTGCGHGCVLCDVRLSACQRVCLELGEVWAANLDPLKEQLAQAFERQSADDDPAEVWWLRDGRCVRLGTMTDAFQPAEKRRGKTAEIMELFGQHNVPYLISTKSILPMDEPYWSLIVRDKPTFCVSIGFPDDEIAARWEPRAPSPSERLAMARLFKEAGVHTVLRVAPLMPGVGMKLGDVRHWMPQWAKAADGILVEFLRYDPESIMRDLVFERTGFDLQLYAAENGMLVAGDRMVYEPQIVAKWKAEFLDAAGEYGLSVSVRVAF